MWVVRLAYAACGIILPSTGVEEAEIEMSAVKLSSGIRNKRNCRV